MSSQVCWKRCMETQGCSHWVWCNQQGGCDQEGVFDGSYPHQACTLHRLPTVGGHRLCLLCPELINDAWVDCWGSAWQFHLSGAMFPCWCSRHDIRASACTSASLRLTAAHERLWQALNDHILGLMIAGCIKAPEIFSNVMAC